MGTLKRMLFGLLPFIAASQAIEKSPVIAYNPADDKPFVSGMKKDRSKSKKKPLSKSKKIRRKRRIVKHSRSINRKKAA